jgi:hypothetical protein
VFCCTLVVLLLWLFFHFVAPACLVDSCRFNESVDADCFRVVEKVVTRWLVELHLDKVSMNVFFAQQRSNYNSMLLVMYQMASLLPLVFLSLRVVLTST